MSFLNRSQGTADIYCFQEVFDLERYSPTKPSNSIRVPDLYPRLREQLDGFEGFLSNPYTSFGERLAIFARSLNISDSGEIALCDDKEIEIEGRRGSFGSRLQWVTVKRPDNSFTVANVHGIWLPSGKGDTSERMKQSRRIEGFLKEKDGAKILCGDFNLLPHTRSIGIIETQGMSNLIVKQSASSTRSRFYPGKERFADYIFTSPEVTVRSFKVLNEEVSDHLPLLMEFD